MDGFSDSLSERFASPQDMINANTGAEATQFENFRDEMKGLIASLNEKIDTVQTSGAAGADTEGFAEQLNGTADKLETHIHKENVRVYRNVQASLVDELGKQSEAIGEKLDGSNQNLIEELSKQTEMLSAMMSTLNEQQKSQGQAISGMAAQMNQMEENVKKTVKNKAILPLQIVMLIIVLGELAINIMLTLGYL